MKTLLNIAVAIAATSVVLAATAVPAAARAEDPGQDRGGASRSHDARCRPLICHTFWRYNAALHRVEKVTDCRCR